MGEQYIHVWAAVSGRGPFPSIVEYDVKPWENGLSHKLKVGKRPALASYDTAGGCASNRQRRVTVLLVRCVQICLLTYFTNARLTNLCILKLKAEILTYYYC